ncbi:protein shisa-9B, partial [Silurus meridionalis]
RRMRSTDLLLAYFLVKVAACDVASESTRQVGSVAVSGSNESRDDESGLPEPPHTEDKCRGYYDVMGQWDPPFVCRTGSYLYCCGTCGFRFCCEFKESRLDQRACTNDGTPPWSITGRPPPKKNDPAHDPTRDKTNLIVYVICGVVAIMALVGIFTKLGLEKAHRPHRENMSRALAQVMRQTGGEEREESLAVHGQPYETLQARTTGNNLQSNQINNVGPGPVSPYPTLGTPMSPYATLGQISHTYEQPQPVKELNKYASLKAVAEKANENFYTNRRHGSDLTTKGTLPLHPVQLEPEPTNPYSPEMPCQKQNGHKAKSMKVTCSHPLPYGSNTISTPGMLRSREASEVLGRRHTYGPKKQSTLLEQVNELTSHSQHYLPPHPYYISNSKTEVTV